MASSPETKEHPLTAATTNDPVSPLPTTKTPLNRLISTIIVLVLLTLALLGGRFLGLEILQTGGGMLVVMGVAAPALLLGGAADVDWLAWVALAWQFAWLSVPILAAAGLMWILEGEASGGELVAGDDSAGMVEAME